MSRPNYDDISYYSCAGKEDGNYIHPTDCTRYIICHNGRAVDMACPDCDQSSGRCAGNPHLVYDVEMERCEWPDTTRCITDEKPAG